MLFTMFNICFNRSEANDLALRLAQQCTKKKDIAILDK